MFENFFDQATSARTISRPVASPRACSMRGAGVRRLAGEREVPVFAVELGAVLNQFCYIARAFFDQHRHGICVAQARSRIERVLNVKLYLVIVAQDDGDAALRVFGIRLCHAIFRQDGDAAPLG